MQCGGKFRVTYACLHTGLVPSHGTRPPTVKKSARSRLIRQTDKSVERQPSCRSVRVGTATRPIKPLSRFAQALWFFTETHSHTNQMKVSSRGRRCRTSHCNAELIRLRGFFFFFFICPRRFSPHFFAFFEWPKLKKNQKKIKISPFPHFLCAWRHDS